MSTQNERSAKAQIIWNSTDSNSITPAMVGSLFYDINVEKLDRDNSNAFYQTFDSSYTKVAAINPTTKKASLVDRSNFNYIQLDKTAINTYDVGKFYWNADKGTYNFGLKNNVELQLGQEQNVYGKAYSAITNGQLVMYRTSQGGHILFEPANFAQLSTNPDLIIGVATQNIALNEFGYITTFGEVNTLNTSSFADGNTLYFGSGNVLQNTIPSGSYFIVGRVNRSHATQGSIFVKPYFVDNNLESKLNKQNNLTSDSDGTKYPTVNAVVGGLIGKLDKGTYTGNASDLKSLIDTKINGSGAENYVSKFTASGTIANSIVYDNGTNLGIGTTSPSEKLDVNGYTKAFGFKVAGGTATQSLTANGGTFDLNTKADLVGGKVPSSQSRPSTIVMDNSTYVITFTDATGAIQTIDLPLESLFQDANYDETTKSLIVTLQDGTTRIVPLSDLVDLPEIVLATSNPAVTPTSGQKVYFNTSLGKVWFNVSGAWVFGGNLISDSEKDNLSTAYDHSQTTGNPHGTTKSDIGLGNVDNTSDLNKPISTATQTALNSKQDNLQTIVGNVGIGTTSPSEKLDVNGKIRASDGFVGNADTATKLQMARNFTIGNTTRSFDGLSDVSWSLSEIGLTIEVTYANALSLISDNQIIPGALYKITGCDVNLYNDGTSSGTTIYLQGITSNSFSKSGYGEFYNPPYNQSINGYGIWTNYMTGNFTKTSSSLTFAVNEYLVANNGATGYYAGDGLIRYNSGDWSGATSVTGNSYGATANVSFFTNPSYSIDTTVIWGGYIWTNLTGSLGSFYNDIILDSINWAKVPYSSGLYNKVLDVIDYDILSDKIVKRNEVEFNNLVAITSSRSAYFSVSNGGMYNNPIALFQWGNKYNGSSKGLSDVRIYDSIFSCINFRGNYLQDIIFENGSSHNANYYHNSSAYKLRITNNSSIYNNVFNNTFPNNTEIDNNSSISSNLFYSGSVNAIKMSNSTISSNSIWGGGIYNNFLDGSNINSNRMYSSPIYQNKLIKNCSIYSNYSSSTSNGIYNNSLEQNSNIYTNTLKGGYTHGIYNNELIINCNIYNNTLNANGDNIHLNTLKVGSNIYGNNLSNSSGIYINNLVGSNIYNNTINNSTIEGHTAVRSTIWGNNISAGSSIRRSTLMGSSSINSLNFTSTTMSSCTLNGTIFNSTASISGKQIFYLTFNGVAVSQDLSSATVFYGTTYKSVLSRADSTPVIQYINNDNILQTVAITT